jgi:hypothetical protein
MMNHQHSSKEEESEYEEEFWIACVKDDRFKKEGKGVFGQPSEVLLGL